MREFFDEQLGDYVVTAGEIPWSVVTVEASPDYSLVIGFSDGSTGRVDCSGLVLKEPFLQLGDISRFLLARVSHGTVEWGGDIDIAPEYLYEHAESIEEEQTE